MFRTYRFPKVMALLLLVVLMAVYLLPGYNAVGAVNPLAAEAALTPKYVFYFIGDGLGASQRTAAEYFLQQQTGNKSKKLVMNTFPAAGINTTHSADTLVTDSAAAGTALATGYKTNNGVISQTPDGKDVKTLIEAAEEKGLATGIVTTTRLTHATPAVFAAHNVSRGNESEIAVDFLDSGVEYFAGGGYGYFVPQNGGLKSKREDDRDLIKEFEANNYKVFVTEESTDDFRNYQPGAEDKVFAAFTYSHLPYEIDRKSNDSTPSLAELTQKGIDLLSQNKKGFFMMIEGGRIDHASHANDAAGTIHDVLAFDEAIAKAYEFYKMHPKETLIVVVGDHETGGMGLGFGKNYFLKMSELQDVKISVEDTLQNKYSEEFNKDRTAYFNYIEENLGLDNLTAEEKAEIEKAMDMVDNNIEDTKNLYGGYDPVAIAVTHVVSVRSNVYWTTYAHSGTAIPMSAVGTAADYFEGYKDNTEIAQTMAKVLKLDLN